MRERVVRGDAAALEAIRLGEHDVERDDGRAELAQTRHQFADHVAPPRPLADAGEAAFVDVDDDDAIARRTGRHRAQQPIVDAVLEAAEHRRTVQREHRDDERGDQAAEQDQPAWPGPREDARDHRTVTSTRRFLGSKTPSAVGTSSSASPCDRTSMADKVEARLHEERANGVGAAQTELGIRLRCARRVGVADHDHVGNGIALDRLKHVLQQLLAFFGQLLGVEPEGQSEVSRRRWQRGEDVAEPPLHVRLAERANAWRLRHGDAG